jgi:hypothetical protein
MSRCLASALATHTFLHEEAEDEGQFMPVRRRRILGTFEPLTG